MIIVVGSIVAKPDSFEEVQRLGMEHTRRSRSEPGCVSHDIHVDCENPMKLTFIEKWADAATLAAHFKVKESIAFVMRARELSASPPSIEIFEASAAKIG
jgi:quinol monooxygenase YgiN